MTKRITQPLRNEIRDNMRKRVIMKVFDLSDYHDLTLREVRTITGFSIAQCSRLMKFLVAERRIRINGRHKNGKALLYVLVKKRNGIR